LKKTDQPYITF